MSKESNKTMSFEEKLKRVEEISSLMESENLSLAKSTALYEEGKKLIDEMLCEIKEAESKLESK